MSCNDEKQNEFEKKYEPSKYVHLDKKNINQKHLSFLYKTLPNLSRRVSSGCTMYCKICTFFMPLAFYDSV